VGVAHLSGTAPVANHLESLFGAKACRAAGVDGMAALVCRLGNVFQSPGRRILCTRIVSKHCCSKSDFALRLTKGCNYKKNYSLGQVNRPWYSRAGWPDRPAAHWLGDFRCQLRE